MFLNQFHFLLLALPGNRRRRKTYKNRPAIPQINHKTLSLLRTKTVKIRKEYWSVNKKTKFILKNFIHLRQYYMPILAYIEMKNKNQQVL